MAGGPRDAARMIDPIEQFNIEKLFTIGHIGNQEIAFTNSSAYMFGSVALISLLMIGGVAGRQLVPGRIQSIAEISYEFVANTIRSTAGKEGMKFFPLVFSIFMFIAVSNIVGIIPYDVHDLEPPHRHRGAGADGVPHRADLRLLQERPEILQAVRAVGHSDLHPAAGGVHRGVLVLPAADLALACVCSPTCWPATSRWRCSQASFRCWRASALSASSAPCCRSAW